MEHQDNIAGACPAQDPHLCFWLTYRQCLVPFGLFLAADWGCYGLWKFLSALNVTRDDLHVDLPQFSESQQSWRLLFWGISLVVSAVLLIATLVGSLCVTALCFSRRPVRQRVLIVAAPLVAVTVYVGFFWSWFDDVSAAITQRLIDDLTKLHPLVDPLVLGFNVAAFVACWCLAYAMSSLLAPICDDVRSHERIRRWNWLSITVGMTLLVGVSQVYFLNALHPETSQFASQAAATGFAAWSLVLGVVLLPTRFFLSRQLIAQAVIQEVRPFAPGNPEPTIAVPHPAIEIWRMKLEVFLIEEAKAFDPAMKFKIQQDIKEARAKILELGGQP